MKLLSLKLLHYRRFRQQEIFFNDDFSLIFGKNGAGKSSILDAIGFVLFGPGKDFVRINRDYLKSYFLSDREPSKVELNFQFGFENYKIVRIIDAGIKKFSSEFIPENKDSLFGPNGLEIIGGDEITEFIKNLLGVSKDTFLRSVFTKQKDLEVLSGGLSERKELINRVLGLDKIELIIENYKKQEKEKKTSLEIYKKRVFDFDLEDLNDKKTRKISEINLILEKLNHENILQQELKNLFEKSKVSFEIEDKKKQKYQEVSNQIQTLLKIQENIEVQNKNINDELSKISQKELFLEKNSFIIEQEKKIKGELIIQEKNKLLFFQISNLKENYKNDSLELEKLQKNISDILSEKLEENIFKIEQEFIFNQQKKEKIFKEKIELENKINYLRKEYDELKKEFESIKNLSNSAFCPTCKRPLEEYFPNLLKLYEEKLLSKAKQGKELKENSLQNIEKLFNEINLILEQNKENLEKLRLKEKQLIRFLENKTNLENKLSQTFQKIKEIGEIEFNQEEFQKLQNFYESIKKQYLEYLQIQGEVRNKQILEDNKSKNISNFLQNENIIKSLKLEIFNLNFSQENYNLLKEDYFSLNNKINEKNSIIQEINSTKLHLEFDLKILEKQESDYLEDKKQIDLYICEIQEINIKYQFLSDYMIYLLSYLKPKIENLASQYFSIITDNKYLEISLDKDYNITIDSKNIDLYSGGERDLANLCLRLALGQNLTNNKGNPINFLILDEILSSQDKDRQQNILFNLKKLENKFSQIILISHLEEVKDLATNLIEVKAVNKEESVIIFH